MMYWIVDEGWFYLRLNVCIGIRIGYLTVAPILYLKFFGSDPAPIHYGGLVLTDPIKKKLPVGFGILG